MSHKFLISILLIAVIASGSIVSLSKYVISPPSKKYLPKSIYIQPQSSAYKIAKQLKEAGFIRHKRLFVYYLKIIRQETKLRSGVFILSPSYSMKRIKNILEEKEGPGSITKITIPEGYTLSEMAQLFEEKGMIKKADFMDYAQNKAKDKFKEKYPFLKEIPTNNIEGYLFPETYFFSKGNSLDIIFNALLNQFSKRILPIWQNHVETQGFASPNITQGLASQNISSLHQTLTLASIIEKEAASKEEAEIIASVFKNRLKKQMKLESCATILYAIGDPDKKIVLYKDLKIKSPYNTYRYQGLPPTPIASPGIHSFKAAVSPSERNFYFFIAKGDGSHYFSQTLREHNRLRNQIQREKLRN